jgi:hypothetical protein
MHTLIRTATIDDSAQISSLIESVARRFCFDPGNGIPPWFLETLTPAAIAKQVSDEPFKYLIAMRENEMAGVIAIRNASHIHHLFVSP